MRENILDESYLSDDPSQRICFSSFLLSSFERVDHVYTNR